MNILFYVEPLVEMGRPYWKDGWATYFCRLLMQALASAPAAKEAKFCIAVSEPVNQRLRFGPEIRRVVFTQPELLEPFSWDSLSASLAWYRGRADKGQMDHYVNLMRGKLADFTPDIIITFSPAPYFRDAFPDALLLHMEYSIFSRPPYPQSWYLDPVGMLGSSFLNRFSENIKHTNLPPEDRAKLVSLKAACQELIRTKSPFNDLLKAERNRFDHLLLLPLQFSGYYGFDGNTFLKSQYEYIVYVMEKVPENIGVVISTHPEYPVLTCDTLKFLEHKYPNLIFRQIFEEFNAASQYLISEVDAVITVSSSVGLQTLLWDKKLISLGDVFGKLLADSDSLDDIEVVLQRPTVDKDAILYWILTRYAVPECYFLDPTWLGEFLANSLRTFREKGITEDFFSTIDSANAIFEKIEVSLDRNIPKPASCKPVQSRLLEKDFQLDQLSRQLADIQRNSHQQIGELSKSLQDARAEIGQRCGDVAYRDGRIKQLLIDIESLNCQMREVGCTLGGKKAELVSAIEINCEFKNQLDVQSTLIINQDDQIRQLKEEAALAIDLRVELERNLRQKTLDLADRADQIRELSEENARVKGMQIELENSLRQMSVGIADRDKQIAILEKTITNVTNDRANQSARLKKKAVLLADWEKRIGHIEEELLKESRAIEERMRLQEESLQKKTDNLQETISRMHSLEEDNFRVIAERDADKCRFTEQIRERDQHIQDLLNSKSWKVTAPLRAILELCKK
jgi:hypothetical protein